MSFYDLNDVQDLLKDPSVVNSLYQKLIGGPVDSAVPMEWLNRLNELCPGIQSKFYWTYAECRVFGQPILYSKMILKCLDLMFDNCIGLEQSFISQARKYVSCDTDMLIKDYMLNSANVVTNANPDFVLNSKKSELGIKSEDVVWLYQDITGSGRPIFISDLRVDNISILLNRHVYELSCLT